MTSLESNDLIAEKILESHNYGHVFPTLVLILLELLKLTERGQNWRAFDDFLKIQIPGTSGT